MKRNVWVTLEAPGAEGVIAPGVANAFSMGDRIRRAAMVLGIGVALAATLIPIPIIHLLGIPLLLIAGVVLASRQLTAVLRLDPLQMRCPKCGAVNRVGGGFGYRSATGPFERNCDACRRALTLQLSDR